MVARVPFPWLPSWWNTIPSPPPGDHEGPPNPTSTTLAPTARPASCLTSRLRFMPMRADYELSQNNPAIHDVGHPYTVLPVILSASFGSLRQSRQILSAAKDDRPSLQISKV